MQGLYIHIPFCVSKCSYCDFYSLPGKQDLINPYIQALLAEAQAYKGSSFETLYIGGGTPSLLGGDGLSQLMKALHEVFCLDAMLEATVEANPDSCNMEFLQAALISGLTRISIGVQSLYDGELKKSGRVHDSQQAVKAIKQAFNAGFRDVSADIMIGLPGQTIASLECTLHKVLSLGVTHVSAYCLSVEQGTPFERHRPDDLPDDEAQAVLYERVRQILGKSGFSHYEISNFSLPGRQCRHNLNYWRGGEYLGLGPAAASHINGVRMKNEADLDKYLADPCKISVESEKLEPSAKIGEEAMLRLRLLEEGLDVTEMAGRYSAAEIMVLSGKLGKMVGQQLLIQEGNRYRLPVERILTSNGILAEVLG